MTGAKFSILFVEDDEALSFIVKDILEKNNYLVRIAENGDKAIDYFREMQPDLIILDIMLPKKDGFQVAGSIRESNKNVPIIFLTARSMTEDKITGLTIGGDDYITKPFSMEELLLKIKIFLKRSNVGTMPFSDEARKKIRIGKYEFHPEELTLSFNGEHKRLTLKEVELIQFFNENRNKVSGRNEILEKIWGTNDYFLGRSLDVFISRLRKYFNKDPDIQIINLHGIGFKFFIKKED